MQHITDEEFIQSLEDCNWADGGEVSKLITSSHTNVKFNEKVHEKLIEDPNGAGQYFMGLFGTDVWADGQGQDEVREFYADPYIPIDFSRFARSMQVANPSLANECDRDACVIPEGGRGTLPGMRMFKWGLETQRTCIANIRHLRDFEYWASRVMRAREITDKQVMDMFYTYATMQLTGHKIVLQGERNAAGQLIPIENTNARNPFRAFSYNYMEELYPAITNAADILPLNMDILELLARHKSQFSTGDHAQVGPRGEYIWELWIGEDFFRQEAIQNPDYIKAISYNMPSKLFAGYALQENMQREIIGNFAPKVMKFLPRFAEGDLGGLVAVDTREGVDIEVGKEYVGAREFENAPFGLAMTVNGKLGTILTRPTLTKSGEGFPIMPIAGNGDWQIRNDYDKDCNKHLNKPYSEKFYEMGFRLDNPDAATGIIYRRRKFRLAPVNECDLAPVFSKANTGSCDITTIGCADNTRKVQNSITKVGEGDYVTASAASCGNSEDAPFMYRVTVERKANQPDFQSLSCGCGNNVVLLVNGADGAYEKQIVGVIKDDKFAFPHGIYFVETQTALAAGECVKGIICQDATPTYGVVIAKYDETDEGHDDLTSTQMLVLTDSPINCDSGTVHLSYRDADGVQLDFTDATIVEVDHLQQVYKLTSASGDFTSAFTPADTASVRLVCGAGA